MRTSSIGRFAVVVAFILAGAVVALVAGILVKPNLKTTSTFRNTLDKRHTEGHRFNEKAMGVFGNRGEPAGENEATDSEPSPTSGAEEQYAYRAYPLAAIPASFSASARASWQAFKENKDGSNGGNNPNDPLVWDLLGPSHATQPGVLSFSGAQFHMAGRTTAMAITPVCTGNNNCRLWIATAGGGIWRTDNPFSPDPKWVFVSQSFGTNAIGTLDQDPGDPTGNTLYAGTGESHASADSEAGVGIYVTNDGGETWNFLPGSNLFATRAISKIVVIPGHIYVGVARGVRGISSVNGGAISRTAGPNDGPDQTPLGLYDSTDGGATFVSIWDGHGSIRGVNDVAVDANDGNAIYAAAYQQGIWRCSPKDGCNPSTATTGQFKQIFTPTSPLQNTDRSQFTLTLKEGGTRLYVEDGAVGPAFVTVDEQRVQVGFVSQVWRADNANNLTAAQLLASQAAHAAAPSPNDPGGGWALKSSLTDTPRSNPYRPAYNPCTGQCWYDNEVYSPAGFPDLVYVLGSYSYSEIRGPSNARGVLLSTTAGDPDPAIGGGNFSDLTWDGTPHAQPDQTHPDQHAIVTPEGQPFLYFEGSDGGVIRSDGQFDDVSDDCAQYHPFATDADSQLLCRRLLSRVPHQLFDTMNKGLSTLQFQSLSLNPKRPLHDAQGGTQDNGTFDWDSQLTTWNESIYGDGGQSGYNYCDDRIRFNEFTGQATDENFQAGKATAWVVTSGPLFNNGESAPFYAAIITDYTNCGSVPGFNTPTAVALNSNQTDFAKQNGGARLGYMGFQYIGMNHVWRTVDNGGPQAYLEANCPEFTTSAANPRCGDWKPLGGPAGLNTAGSLTGTSYGATKAGGNVAVVERNPADNGTAWAATTLGRVFITHNINAVDPNAVVWQRIDDIAVSTPPNATPPLRFVSSIYPDPANLNRAYVAYSGYNGATPSTPGHVFDVTVLGAASTFRDLHVEQGTDFTTTPANGDLPITDLVKDDYTGDLYAATDFGVVRGVSTDSGLTYAWAKAGSSNFPFVEVPGLTIDPCSRVLYAATHGRSIWRMFLPKASNAPNQPCPRTP